MRRDWQKERAKGAKHARLMKRRPDLRDALYGKQERRAPEPKDRDPRETAKRIDNG